VVDLVNEKAMTAVVHMDQLQALRNELVTSEAARAELSRALEGAAVTLQQQQAVIKRETARREKIMNEVCCRMFQDSTLGSLRYAWGMWGSYSTSSRQIQAEATATRERAVLAAEMEWLKEEVRRKNGDVTAMRSTLEEQRVLSDAAERQRVRVLTSATEILRKSHESRLRLVAYRRLSCYSQPSEDFRVLRDAFRLWQTRASQRPRRPSQSKAPRKSSLVDPTVTPPPSSRRASIVTDEGRSPSSTPTPPPQRTSEPRKSLPPPPPQKVFTSVSNQTSHKILLAFPALEALSASHHHNLLQRYYDNLRGYAPYSSLRKECEELLKHAQTWYQDLTAARSEIEHMKASRVNMNALALTHEERDKLNWLMSTRGGLIKELAEVHAMVRSAKSGAPPPLLGQRVTHIVEAYLSDWEKRHLGLRTGRVPDDAPRIASPRQYLRLLRHSSCNL
jgi:hypothetical protein